MTTQNKIWNGAYKIPWDDIDFSKRMLNEHLSQDHDLASRRDKWIDKQVQWIHSNILKSKPSKILDLGCGPGLYSLRLAKLGHRCRGIDFSPASIEYACHQNDDSLECEFTLGDIRKVNFDGPYDLVLLLYGEFNVFSPEEALLILKKAHSSLACQGKLLLELQTFLTVQTIGLSETTEYETESGLFSDQPHSCVTENQWLPDQNVAIQTFTIKQRSNEEHSVYRSTTKAWSDNELITLLNKLRFCSHYIIPTWPDNTEALSTWVAEKKKNSEYY